jgi:hypothetical protein
MISNLPNARLGRRIDTVSYSFVQPRPAWGEMRVQPRREAGVQIRVEGIVAASTPQQQRVKAASYKCATKKTLTRFSATRRRHGVLCDASERVVNW